MNFSTHISELEPPIPDPQPLIEKALAIYDEVIKVNAARLFLSWENLLAGNLQ
ncbi:MAG: hypothetical protein ACKVRN_14525 [Pyrinomonadaceae bacterium]